MQLLSQLELHNNNMDLHGNDHLRVQVILSKKKKYIKKFEKIGSQIGLLFQIADDLIDENSSIKKAGKKTKKDFKKGKATLIGLLGQKNAIKQSSCT